MGCPTALPRPQIKTYSSWTYIYIYKDQKTKELSFRLLRLQNLEYWWNSTKSIWNFPLIFYASVRPQTPAFDFGRLRLILNASICPRTVASDFRTLPSDFGYVQIWTSLIDFVLFALILKSCVWFRTLDIPWADFSLDGTIKGHFR